jgi:hypothetical protein
MKRTRAFSYVFAAMFPVLALSAVNGCGNKKDDDTTPTASAAPPPPPPPATASAPAIVVPEEPDAGADAGDAGDAGPAKFGGGGGAFGHISRCCAALRANAKSAPPEQMGGYMAAAQACEGLKNTPAANMAFSQIRMFLAGAKMPGACQ